MAPRDSTESQVARSSTVEFLWLEFAALCKQCQAGSFQRNLHSKSSWFCDGRVGKQKLEEALWSMHLLDTLLGSIFRDSAIFLPGTGAIVHPPDNDLDQTEVTDRSLLADARRFIVSICQDLSASPFLAVPVKRALKALISTCYASLRRESRLFHLKCRQSTAAVTGNLVLLSSSPCVEKAISFCYGPSPDLRPSCSPCPRQSLSFLTEAAELALAFLCEVVRGSRKEPCEIGGDGGDVDADSEGVRELQQFAANLLTFVSDSSAARTTHQGGDAAPGTNLTSAQQLYPRPFGPRTIEIAASFLRFAVTSLRKTQEGV